MIYSLLISTTWGEVSVTQFEVLSQYFDILLYSS